MNSIGASSPSFDSSKTKKQETPSPDPNNLTFKTPEKPSHAPRRPLTRRQTLLSVNQIRDAAKKLRKTDPKDSLASDPLMTSDDVTETVSAKPNTAKPLPERYEILDEFFNGMQSCIRYLGLKGYVTSMAKISPAVESLTDRRFSYRHLAQLKYLLPEAIEVKKILVRDDRTSCMKPDLVVSLDFGVVRKDGKEVESGNLRLRKLFRMRLVEFCKNNPEGDEVPEDTLPEPFNQSSQVSLSIPVEKPNVVSVPDVPYTISQGPPVAASHIPPSFKRRFSRPVPTQNVETAEQVVDRSIAKVVCIPNVPSPVKCSAKLPETPIKSFDLDKKKDLSSVDGTPAKHILSPFSATPAQASRPLIRGIMTPDEESMMSPKKLTRRPSGTRRPITFDTPVKSKTPPVQRVSADDDDLYDILDEDLLSSIKGKEQVALEEKDPALSQAKWRKQMVAGLPKLFDTILFFFQSIKRSVATKQELMHMIFSSQLEIVDQREVDEQLRLLEELAPEWIYQKVSSSGDLLFCVKKISSPESIRARLSEAN
ncbi:CDT1 Geminin-binding domain-like protein [Artemisia annua]|uniref:CDT1 Geminin-binding domain-like protein n=1 Tax=Artemisia annua TaxID=35608 RepID=A0A2U1L4A4_ARTAN|nr:CDT1 Geminin-binding domain-like protein [Artemisia annua]